MEKPLVVGVGNSLCGDDGVGAVVVNELCRYREKNGEKIFETLCVADDPLKLLDLWENRPLVVIIDSYQLDSSCQPQASSQENGAQSGIKQWQQGQVGQASKLPFETGGFSSHMFGLAETIELGQSLNRLPPKILLLALPGESYGVGEKLSARAQSLVEQVKKRVLEFLKIEGGYA